MRRIADRATVLIVCCWQRSFDRLLTVKHAAERRAVNNEDEEMLLG